MCNCRCACRLQFVDGAVAVRHANRVNAVGERAYQVVFAIPDHDPLFGRRIFIDGVFQQFGLVGTSAVKFTAETRSKYGASSK